MKQLILVVDDDAGCRDVLTQVLGCDDHDVITAQNGLEALAAARQRRPRLILLDLIMPVMDGFEFRAQQRNDPAISNIPIICISGASDVQKAAVRMGAVDCFGKPIDLTRLLASVRAIGHDHRVAS